MSTCVVNVFIFCIKKVMQAFTPSKYTHASFALKRPGEL